MSNKALHLGKYELVERLGAGGMAEVWKARMTGPQGYSRTLAIKQILPHLGADEEFVQLFVAEARISALFSHANVVQVFELDELDGRYYLVMEHVEGCDLRTLIRACASPHHPGMGAYVVRELLRGLAYIHGLRDEAGEPRGLFHRDVSPSNVMLAVDGSVKLVDFGIAKSLSPLGPRTETGTRRGKEGYMAPEQWDGLSIDCRVDLYAAGVVLFEALTGHLGSGARVQVPSGLPTTIAPELAQALERVCQRARAPDRALRYQNAEEMLADLDPIVHALAWDAQKLASLVQPLVARRATEHAGAVAATVSLVRRPAARRRAAVSPASLAALGVAVALGFGMFFWGPVRRPVSTPSPAVAPQLPAPGLPEPPQITPIPSGTATPPIKPVRFVEAPSPGKRRVPTRGDVRPSSSKEVEATPKKAHDLRGGRVVDPFNP